MTYFLVTSGRVVPKMKLDKLELCSSTLETRCHSYCIPICRPPTTTQWPEQHSKQCHDDTICNIISNLHC